MMITDTVPFRNPNYHRPTDQIDTIDIIRLARIVHGPFRCDPEPGKRKSSRRNGSVISLNRKEGGGPGSRLRGFRGGRILSRQKTGDVAHLGRIG